VSLRIRRERPEDEAAARVVQVAAFRRPDAPEDEPVEARLLDELRTDAGWIAELSLVAEQDGEVVGHVVCTRGEVGGEPALGLGPIGVRPDRQGRGIGSALVHAVVAAAEAREERLVALLGSTDWYPRFGFVPATSVGIEPPDAAWGDHFQVRHLGAGPAWPTGPFRYAAPFDRL